MNLAVAIAAGLAVEILGIVSVYNAMALYRWQHYGHVKKETDPWEQAPFRLALACVAIYIAATAFLLLFLEAWPEELAGFAPFMFPFLGIVAAANLVVLDQHLSRLRRYHLTWDLVKNEDSDDGAKPKQTKPRTRALVCEFCNREFRWPTKQYKSERAAKNALNPHQAACKRKREKESKGDEG